MERFFVYHEATEVPAGVPFEYWGEMPHEAQMRAFLARNRRPGVVHGGTPAATPRVMTMKFLSLSKVYLSAGALLAVVGCKSGELSQAADAGKKPELAQAADAGKKPVELAQAE